MQVRTLLALALSLALGACTTSEQNKLQPLETVAAKPSRLEVDIHAPTDELFSTGQDVWLDIEGAASAIGGVRHLDIMLVLDRSQSLSRTDPEDYRKAAAIGFVEALSDKSDALIGVVGFDDESELMQGLTADRDQVVAAIEGLRRDGRTDLAAGIRSALGELAARRRPGSSQLMLLFTDGKSNQRKAREATREAQGQDVTVHTLLLGDNAKGASILEEIALGTGGTFVQVTDPAKLPEAFLNLRTTGIDRVTLSVDGTQQVETTLTGGSFAGRVQLPVGRHRIVATATSLDEQMMETAVTVEVHDASCAALDVVARHEGLPALSLNDRGVEIVIDASRSMWGRMDGVTKMEVARNSLREVVQSLPLDLDVALRAYGSTSPSEVNDCADSGLMVPFGSSDRVEIGAAIDSLKPKGQTPLAFALGEAGSDFATFDGERTVVLVTDGIESCGGDPVNVARMLNQEDIVTHVIGFGFENDHDEDKTGLAAIAEAGGGKYFVAGSAQELEQALQETVGTSYRVLRGDTVVAESVLGSKERIFLPSGAYRVQLDSVPPREMPLRLSPRDDVTLTLSKSDGVFGHATARRQLAPTSCATEMARMERLRLEDSVSALNPEPF